MIGRVKTILSGGYGFISIGTEDIFFHLSEYKGNWKELVLASPPYTKEGPEVQFKVIEHVKGPRATGVELLEIANEN